MVRKSEKMTRQNEPKEREVKFNPEPMRKRTIELIAALFLLTVVTTAGWAQNLTIRGQVVDEFGAAIPNAEIKLTDKDGRTRTAKSNFAGEFTMTGLAAGTYSLSSSYEGFAPYLDNQFKVPMEKGSLTVVMAVAAVNIIQEVAANNSTVSTEPDQNMNATVLGDEFIKNLPDNEDDLRDFLNALGGSAAGSQGGAQILVDGFTGGRLPPKDSIQQIRINQNPFSAEFSNPGFSRIEIITKPGNDSWRGAARFGYRNSATDARNAFALTRPDASQQQYGFNFGGPLIRKRLSFQVNADYNQTDGSNPTVATTLTGPLSINVPGINETTFIGTRVDVLLNNKNTLNVNYDYRRTDSLNREFAVRFGGGFGFGFGGGGGGGRGGGGGGGSLLLPERGSDSYSRGHNLRLGETWIINSRLIHEARLQYQRDSSEAEARTNGLAINVLDSFSGGGSTCCPNVTNTNSLEFQDYLTYSDGKKHTIKGGFQLEYDRIKDLSGSNFNGTYTFTNLEQYRFAFNNPGNTQARATQYSVNRGNPSIEYNVYRASWFVQDDFRIARNFTLSYGVRHEFQDVLPDKVNFAPRVGIAWSPFKSNKTTIRLGAGMFYQRLTTGLYENTLRFDGKRQESIIIRNPIFNPADPFIGNPTVEIGNTVLRVLDPSLKAPYTINTSLAVEQQLPAGLIGTVTYLFNRGVHQFRSRNVNAPFPGATTRPDPTQGNIFSIESTASSEYNGFQFGLNRRFSQKLSFFGNYTLSWTRNDADGSTSTPANNYDLRAEWGPAFTDRRHNFFLGGFYNMPKGFRFNTFINASSGSPFNITTGTDDNGDFTINDRPAGINRNSDLPSNLYSLLPSRLVCPPGTTCIPGGGGLVQLRDYLAQAYPDGVRAVGPGLFTVNSYLSKSFGFGKVAGQTTPDAQAGGGRGGGGGGRGPGGGGMGGRGGGFGGPGMMGGGVEGSRYTLTLTMGVTNLFNRVNLGQFGGVLGSSFFGRASSAGPARQIDFNVRFSF